jgi:hypothetical protein
MVFRAASGISRFQTTNKFLQLTIYRDPPFSPNGLDFHDQVSPAHEDAVARAGRNVRARHVWPRPRARFFTLCTARTRRVKARRPHFLAQHEHARKPPLPRTSCRFRQKAQGRRIQRLSSSRATSTSSWPTPATPRNARTPWRRSTSTA